MKHVLGIINCVHQAELPELTSHRCLAALPFGGRYRLIDFTLSSMVNSNIENVGVFTCQNYRSLSDHLRTGKDWDLDRKQNGLFLFPATNDKGDLASFYKQMDYFEKSSEEYVLITYGDLVTNIDFGPIIKQHICSNADVTVVYKNHNNGNSLEVDEFQNVTSLKGENGFFESLNLIVLHKDLFMTLIKEHANESHFLLDVLSEELKSLKVKGYKYNEYAEKIHSIQDYYQCNMQLLQPEVMKQLFLPSQEIYTKLKDEPPAKYLSTSHVRNSIIANGCVIEGEVENSILFRGVHVKKGASIKNSIVMQKCQVGEFAKLEGMILDKEVIIYPNENLFGSANKPKIIPKKEIVRANTV